MTDHTIRCETKEDRIRYIHRHDTWEEMLGTLKEIYHSARATENQYRKAGDKTRERDWFLLGKKAQQAIAKAEGFS